MATLGVTATDTNYLTLVDAHGYKYPWALGNSFTVMCWVRPTALPVSGQHIASAIGNGGSDGWRFLMTTSGIVTYQYLNGGSASSNPTSGPAVSAGKWCHVAFVYRAVDTTAEIYVDGVRTIAVTESLAMGSSLTIMEVGHPGDSGDSFNGAFAHARYFNGQLSGAEITAERLSPVVLNVRVPCLLDLPLAANGAAPVTFTDRSVTGALYAAVGTIAWTDDPPLAPSRPSLSRTLLATVRGPSGPPQVVFYVMGSRR